MRRLLLVALFLFTALPVPAVPYRPSLKAREDWLSRTEPPAEGRLWEPHPEEARSSGAGKPFRPSPSFLGLERRGCLAQLRVYYGALDEMRRAEGPLPKNYFLRPFYVRAFGREHAGKAGTELWVVGRGGKRLLRVTAAEAREMPPEPSTARQRRFEHPRDRFTHEANFLRPAR